MAGSVGASIIRIGSWGPLYYNHNEEPPKVVLACKCRPLTLNPNPNPETAESAADHLHGALEAPTVAPAQAYQTPNHCCLAFLLCPGLPCPALPCPAHWPVVCWKPTLFVERPAQAARTLSLSRS